MKTRIEDNRKSICLGVLTYEIKHRKTYDTLCLLKANGYQNVTVYAQPLHYKKTFQPLLRHRPADIPGIPELEELCRNFSYSITYGKIEELEIPEEMVLLVCGAGIIPEDIVKTHKIINSHPGYIPFVRGLDAFKWAIWEGMPIGVTTHLIGDIIDGGEVIDRQVIDINKNTTFFEAAQDVYEKEISMLVESIQKLDEKHMYLEPENHVLHKRMPHEMEEQLLECFEEYKVNMIDVRLSGGVSHNYSIFFLKEAA